MTDEVTPPQQDVVAPTVDSTPAPEVAAPAVDPTPVQDAVASTEATEIAPSGDAPAEETQLPTEPPVETVLEKAEQLVEEVAAGVMEVVHVIEHRTFGRVNPNDPMGSHTIINGGQ